MKTDNVEDIYELSPGQQGILFDSLHSSEADTYLVQSIFALNGPLDQDAFREAWRLTIDSNASLRASFHWESLDKPLQVIKKGAEAPWQVLDLRGQDTVEQQRRLKEYLSSDRASGMDLARSPLMRFALVLLDEEAHEFILTSHHLILDGWSKASVLDEAFRCYDSLSRGLVAEQRNRPRYRDYIIWLQRQDLGEVEHYWRNALQGVIGPTRLPDSTGPAVARDDNQFEEENLTLSNEETVALNNFGHLHSCTLNTLMFGAWSLLLSRYSDSKKVMFGATVASRPSDLAEFTQIVGLLINTIPAIVEFRPRESVIEWLQRIQREQAIAREFHHTPLFKLRGWGGLPAGDSLFETVLVFENYPALEHKSYNRLAITRGRSIERATFPLTIIAGPSQELNILAIYKVSRFGREEIRHMLGHYRTILNELIRHPLSRVDCVSMLTADQGQQVLMDGRGPVSEQRVTCFHNIFEEQVDRTPKARAAISEYDELNYDALDMRANQVAHYLRELGVRPEVGVGLCMERGLDVIVSALAIWKAGGFVVPLDPSYPEARLSYMIEDSRIRCLLTQTNLQSLISTDSSYCKICLDAQRSIIEKSPTQRMSTTVERQNLAYVIYTSGSTGIPKGVAIEHCGLCNVAEAQREFGLREGDRMLQFASLSFDASIFEISMALTSGASLVLLPHEKAQFSARLFQMISNGEVTAVTIPPSVAATLPEEKAGDLRVMTVAGEACSPGVIRRWATGRRFWNLYGPTECTIWATSAECTAESVPVTIGKPIANTSAYFLDVNLAPVPMGVPAELYLSGVGLARGYLGRPGLTAERFLPNPFSEVAGSRMYQTGDRVKLLHGGQIEFLGRRDNQIKVRGVRIELGEIESSLKQHAEVDEAVVVARNHGTYENEIVAYYSHARGAKIDSDDIRTWLRRRLPAYMIPLAIVLIRDWPRTANGKIDHGALPAPELVRPPKVELAPERRTLVERELTEIWRQVLDAPDVGLQDNFFDIGGNSLLAIRLFGALKPIYGERISITDLFEFPNIRALASHLSNRSGALLSSTGSARGSLRRASAAARQAAP